jgi:hypothetical protein
LGKIEESREPAEAALHFCQELGLGRILQWALEVNAEILANHIPIDEKRINEMMEQAAALVERSDSSWYRIEHLMTRARISLKLERRKVAQDCLSEARSLYGRMGLEDATERLRSIEDALRRSKAKGE